MESFINIQNYTTLKRNIQNYTNLNITKAILNLFNSIYNYNAIKVKIMKYLNRFATH